MSFTKGAVYPAVPTTARGTATKISASKDKILYASGKTVVIRDLSNPGLSIAYTGHVHPTTAARISPSGYYCASADAVGTVRVWDVAGTDQTLKSEYKVISGRINDLAWDGESKRIIAVGEGREKFGHAFMMDTGSSTGEISGHSKAINAVSIRHQRPYRAATAADDSTIIFHQGVPWKYSKTIQTHTKFVQDVRYSGSGDHFASVGTDAKVFLYDGKTGDTLGEMGVSEHKGSITACAWSPDDASLVTAAADCTVKIWDIETRAVKHTYTLGQGVPHQQVGATWAAAGPVSLSLSGLLNVFDPRAGGSPRVIYGPQKAITAAVTTTTPGTFLVGTADGRVLAYSTSGEAELVGGPGEHTNLVTGLALASGKTVLSIGYDDRVREIELGGGAPSFTQASTATAAQPRALAVAGDGTAFVAESSGIEAIRSHQALSVLKTAYAPSAVAATGSTVAAGGEDAKVRLYDWDGKALKEVAVLEENNKGTVSTLSFSPDGSMLAAGDSSGKIILFDVKERKTITSRWAFHTARINALSWTADGRHCVSGSLDTHVYVWSVAKPGKNIAIKNAGMGGVNAVVWLSDDDKKGRVASAGADASVRTWDVTFHVGGSGRG